MDGSLRTSHHVDGLILRIMGLCLGQSLTQRLRADEQTFLVNIAPVSDLIHRRPGDAAHSAYGSFQSRGFLLFEATVVPAGFQCDRHENCPIAQTHVGHAHRVGTLIPTSSNVYSPEWLLI